MNKLYKCKQCEWIGPQNQLESDIVETCFGNDQIATCPICGSYDVVELEDITK